MALKIHGVLTALITPFSNGKVDEDALRALTRRQLDAGVHGLVPLGSTGEAATLDFEERAVVIRLVLEETAGRVPVIVGAGTNNTKTTIDLVHQAKELGADAAMVVVPYYNKPTPAGMLAHFRTVSTAVNLPLLAYNVPSRTAIDAGAGVLSQLREIPNYIGLKEASGKLEQAMDIRRETPADWSLLSGEDALLLAFLAIGGQGLISTSANIAPKAFVAVYDHWRAGRLEEARDGMLALMPLIHAMFGCTNPIPAKAAAAALGLCKNELRLPLLPMEGEDFDRLAAFITEFSPA